MTAVATSWKREPFVAGVSLPYNPVFAANQLERLKAGLIPRVMEDKWFIYYEEPHLFLHRSWTGKPVYRLTLIGVEDGLRATEALWSQDLADADKSGDREYQAELLDFLISNLLLGQMKTFPRPQSAVESQKGLLQHHISGTGYPEHTRKSKKS